MICTLIGGVRFLQRDRWRGPVSENDAPTASKRAAAAQEPGRKAEQYRADEPADLLDRGPQRAEQRPAALAAADPARQASVSAARRGMRVPLGAPLVGVGLGLLVGLVLWLGRPRRAR